MHGLERSGLLKSVLKNAGGHSRRVYKITSAGKKALDKARAKVDELHHELHEEHPGRFAPQRQFREKLNTLSPGYGASSIGCTSNKDTDWLK